MTKTIGIDLGSRTTKIVLLEDDGISFRRVFPTGYEPWKQIHECLSKLGEAPVVATGYGRHQLRERLGAKCVTEIRACALGCRREFPEARLILDVGGQDCKVILLDEKGDVESFEMNDRCAAGTGKFIEVMAMTFHVPLDEFVKLALHAGESITVNSMCTVFAESEVISLITSGKPRESIALGLHESIARRLHAMLTRFSPVDGDVVFLGGGAKNDCLHALLEKLTGWKIKRPREPQIMAALGAAMVGWANNEY